MGRINLSVAEEYRLINQDATSCFYCEKPVWGVDYTPAPSQIELAVTEKVSHKVCKSCWYKIYTANISNGATKFGVPKGCMTVEHKLSLFHRGTPSTGLTVVDGLIRPAECKTVGPDVIMYRGTPLARSTVVWAQGFLAMRMLSIPQDNIQAYLEVCNPGVDVSPEDYAVCLEWAKS